MVEKRKKKVKFLGGFFSTPSANATEKLQWVKWPHKTGHGFAAEDANALNDMYRGKNVIKEGMKNTKNGPDRIVNGRLIQTKYYRTAQETVDSAFDPNIGYKYKGQLLEVPKDQFEKAVEILEHKIRQGKVKGVSDPSRAKEIVKQGDYTYQQAKNIAKAGNIDSIVFDIKVQSIVSLSAFGISFALNYATCRWSGMKPKDALKISVVSGLKTGGVVLGAGVITHQLLRTSAGRNFAAFTSKVSKKAIDQIYNTEIGKKFIHKLASAIIGKNVVGAAAKNTLIKLLRTNIVTASITTAVMSAPDFYKALVSKRISWKQFSKNLVVTASGVAGGMAGALGGAKAGAAIGTTISPLIGTAIGSVVGGALGALVGGLVSSAGSKKIVDLISEDDAKEMFKLMQESVSLLATDYLIIEDEFEVIAKEITSIVNPKWLEKMYQAGRKHSAPTEARYRWAYEQLEPLFVEALKNRTKIEMPRYHKAKWQVRKTYLLMLWGYVWSRILMLFGKESVVS